MKRLGLIMSILFCVPVLAGCYGTQAPASPSPPPGAASPTAQAKASITLIPNTVTVKKEADIKVYGSGFTPGTSVSIGMPGVPSPSKLSDTIWYGAQTVNKYGAIEYSISLSSGLWSSVGVAIPDKDAPGVYTVIAVNPQGEAATAPLYVIAPPPPAPSPTPTPKPAGK